MSKIHKIKNVLGLYLPALILLITIALLFYFFSCFQNPYMMKNLSFINEGWQYYTSNDAEIKTHPNMATHMQLVAGETIYLSRTINEQSPDATIMLMADNSFIKVSLDDEVLFSNFEKNENAHPGRSIQYIPLGDNYVGKMLHIESCSPFPLYAASPGSIAFGDSASLSAYVFSQYWVAGNSVVLFVVIGLLFMSMAIYSSIKYKLTWQWYMFAFGIFTILCGTDLIGRNYIMFYAFPPVFASDFPIVIFVLIPLCLCPFIYHFLTDTKKFFLIFAIIYAVGSVATVVYKLITKVHIPMLLEFLNPLFYMLILAIVFFLIIEFFKKNEFVRFISPSVVIILASVLLSMIDIFGFYHLKEAATAIGILSFNILVWVYLISTLIKIREKEKRQTSLLVLRKEMLEQDLCVMQNKIKQTTIMRHDIQNHFGILHTLHEKKEYDKLEEYLNSLVDITAHDTMIYSRNPVINAIISKVALRAAENEVEFIHEINIDKYSKVPDVDLAILVTNMLDNAVEACLLLPKNERWIEIKLVNFDHFLLVTCINSMRDEQLKTDDSGLLSSKSPSDMHGLGIPAMQQVAEKYGSRLNIGYRNGVFNIKTILMTDSPDNAKR